MAAGKCVGKGFGKGKKMGQTVSKGLGAGPAGFCICPNCGEKIKHQAGVPCYTVKCPKCGTSMMRE